jgi:hypothetical protein
MDITLMSGNYTMKTSEPNMQYLIFKPVRKNNTWGAPYSLLFLIKRAKKLDSYKKNLTVSDNRTR